MYCITFVELNAFSLFSITTFAHFSIKIYAATLNRRLQIEDFYHMNMLVLKQALSYLGYTQIIYHILR